MLRDGDNIILTIKPHFNIVYLFCYLINRVNSFFYIFVSSLLRKLLAKMMVKSFGIPLIF